MSIPEIIEVIVTPNPDVIEVVVEGPQGPPGTNGTNGTNGTDGVDGADGVSITGASVNGSGHLILTLSSGGPVDAGLVKGADGADGSDGADGADGADGVSITGASVNGSGHLILTLSTGGTVDAGLVKGADGADGTDGTDGTDGSNGVSITGASVDGSYHLILTLSSGGPIDAGYVRGPAGADGSGSGDMSKSTYDTNDDGKVNAADAADSVPWSGVSGKPTTLSGYGITDAMAGAGTVTSGNPVVFSGTTGKAVTEVSFATFKTSLSLVKGDVGLGNVDNTSDATKWSASAALTNKTINGPDNTITNLALSMFASGVVDTDTALAANSDTRVATQKAVKAYADALIASQDAMVFKGVIDCSANPNYPAADRGWTYRVSVAGKIGGGSGVNVEAGDLLLCLTDSTASGNHATVGANWAVVQANLDGAVIGPSSVTAGNLAAFDGTTGKLIKQLTPSEVRTLLGLVINTDVQAYSAVLAALASGVSLSSGAFTVTGTSASGSSVRIAEDTDNGTNYVALKAPDSIATNLTFTLPSADGTSGQALMSDGAGTLYFGDAGGLQVGDILMSGRANPGASYLKCTGAAVLKASYSGLFAALLPVYPAYNSSAAKLSNPATLPTGNGQDAAWSPNGRYMAIAHTTSPYITVYDFVTNSPVKLSNPGTLPSSNCLSCAWSPDSRFLAVGMASSSIFFYDLQSGSVIYLAQPTGIVSASWTGLAWSPDGNYFAAAGNVSPYVFVWPWSTSGTGTKLSNPATLPTGGATDVAWSSNSRYLAVVHATTPYLTVYDINTGSLVKKNNPNTTPTNTPEAVIWYGGLYIAVGQATTTPRMSFYDFTGEATPTKLADPATLPSNGVYDLSVSPDGLTLSAATAQSTAYMHSYNISTPSAPVALTSMTNAPSGTSVTQANGVAWSPQGRYLALTYAASNTYVTIYDMDTAAGYNPVTEFKLPTVSYGWVKAS